MRGLAYGILDPERRALPLALMHRDECPACRAYVLSLRGLAAVLPSGAAAAGARRWSTRGAGRRSGSGRRGAAPAVGRARARRPRFGVGGALTASGRGRGRRAGGGWLLAGGPVGAKLAVGCLLALGVGAGCVALTEVPVAATALSTGVMPCTGMGHARSGARLTEPATAGDSRGLAPALRSAAAPASRRRGGGAHCRGESQPRVRARAGLCAECILPGRSILHAQPTRGPPQRRRGRSPTTGEFTSTAKPASAGQPAPSSSGGPRGAAEAPPSTSSGSAAPAAGAREKLRPAGKTLVSRASASGLPRGRSLPVAIGAQRVQALADDVDPVLVGEAQAQVGAERLALLDGARAVIDGEVPGGNVGIGELPLEGRGAGQAVVGVDLAADRVEQQGHGLGIALGGSLAHADHAGFARARGRAGRPRAGRGREAAAAGPGSVSSGRPAERSLVVIEVKPSTPTSS